MLLKLLKEQRQMLEKEKIAVEARNEELMNKLAGFEETQAHVDAMGGEEKVHEMKAEMEREMAEMVQQ